MEMPRGTDLETTRPARVTSGTVGYFRNSSTVDAQDGSVLDNDFLNDIVDEVVSLVTTPTGGNTSLSTSTTQWRDAILAMIGRAIKGGSLFIPNLTNVSPVLSNFTKLAGVGGLDGANNGNLLVGAAGTVVTNHPTQTVSISAPVTDATHVLARVWLNTNAGGNCNVDLWVRKNSGEAWQRKMTIDPEGAGFEGEHWATFPIAIDTSTKTFQYYVQFNRTANSSTGGLTAVYIVQEGQYISTI